MASEQPGMASEEKALVGTQWDQKKIAPQRQLTELRLPIPITARLSGQTKIAAP
jgi:hypothetical protein